MTLRPHQLRALEDVQSKFSEGHPHAILSMACGTGKTLVADECFKESQLLVITAPFIALCEQLADRFAERDSSIEVIRAWSSSTTGCTTEEIEASLSRAIPTRKRVILLITYTSVANAHEALLRSCMPFDVVVDEAHNAGEDVHDLARSAQYTLLLTATPTEELVRAAGGIPIAHKISLREAIDAKLSCEYELIIPMATDAIGLELDVEISNFRGGDEWAARAFFLVGQMLDKGRRRCIVFCESQERCRDFGELLVDVCKDHFGVKMNAHKITSECSASARRETLRQFQSPLSRNVIEMHVLCAVRIMDEGQDVPSCDSVFWSNSPSTTDSGKIRVVQQLSRALRMHDGKTVASVFIWTRPDNLDLVDMLGRLRAEDPDLARRVRVVSGAYDRLDNKEYREQVRTAELSDTDSFVSRFRLTGVSFFDAARNRFISELAAYHAREGHSLVPNDHRTTTTGYRLGAAVSRVRFGQLILPEDLPRRAQLTALGFVWDVHEERRNLFMREITSYQARIGNARVPTDFVADSGYPLGRAVCNVRSGWLILPDDEARRATLASIGFVWSEWDAKRDDFLHELATYHAKNGHSLVPIDFKTPADYPLGKTVSHVRQGRLILPTDLPRRARLEELEFVWDARKRPRNN